MEKKPRQERKHSQGAKIPHKTDDNGVRVEQATIADLIPDDKNFNKGTQFGQHLIKKSLSENGAGRSILLDKNNRIIAGNKTTENAAAIDMNDVIIVETDGSKLVAVKRTDIDLDSEQGRKMALADNATSAANLDWDEEQLKAISEEMDGFDPEEWGITMKSLAAEVARQIIDAAGSRVATEAYSDDTNYDLNKLYRKRVNEDIVRQIDSGVKAGKINKKIADVLRTRSVQCSVFNFDEIIKYYRSNDATPEEKELLRRLYLVFVTPKEMFDTGVLKITEVSNIIFDNELMMEGDGDENGDE